MRSRPASHLLTFMFPPGASPMPGDFADSDVGCIVEYGTYLVSIMGPSREAVFDHAAKILQRACQGMAPLSIAGRLYTLPPEQKNDGRDWLHVGSGTGGVDTWSIIVGAHVAFSPTAIDPHLPDLAELPARSRKTGSDRA